jgi:glycosyltransferase involved in cell wall biosynthesis
MTVPAPFLLDCTRAVSRRFAGDQPSGIDRVCDAYATHFASTAQAVVQYRGKARVLSQAHSRRLFELLESPLGTFRRRFARFAPKAFAAGQTGFEGRGGFYLNVSHTDFDLPAHHRWVQQCDLKAIYLIHDLIPITHPQWTTPHRAARHHSRVVAALRSASGIVVNSQVTAEDLLHFAKDQGLAVPAVLNAPLAASEMPSVAMKSGAAASDPYFVCISTIEARKNHLLLLKVWRRLIAHHGEATPKLVLIGKWGVRSTNVRRYIKAYPSLARYVTIRNDCSDAEVARVLMGARALLAPSRAEGFGLSVAEALKMGVPVIVSNLPSFVEIAAGIPHYLDPNDEAGWCDAVMNFLEDSSLRKEQLMKLGKYSAPRWQDHFALLERWLSDVFMPCTSLLSSAGPFQWSDGAAHRDSANLVLTR